MDRVLLFDIDGTMEFGDPPGPVPVTVVSELAARGYLVGSASDWPPSGQRRIWAENGIEPHFVGGKHNLDTVRARFEAVRYVHVGDTDVDERYALLASFDFLLVTELALPVIADAIHDASGDAR